MAGSGPIGFGKGAAELTDGAKWIGAEGGQGGAEEGLIRAARRGDSRAFDQLVRRYQDYLYRLMVRACHHPQDAEEVTVEAFARAYDRLAQFEGRSSFVSWLGRIAGNLCIRRRERKEPPSVSLEEWTGSENGPHTPPPSPGPTPEERALQGEMRQVLLRALGELPEPDRTVLQLRDIEGLTTVEAAARLELTVPAVKARLHRARRQLREKLNYYFLGE